MPLKVLHSFIHQTDEKITSLTVSLGEDGVFITLSDKKSKNRVKLGLDEVAGLADAVERNRNWSAFHTFTTLENKESRNRINYADGFFSIEGETKIAMKLAENEKVAFARTLDFAFERILLNKLETEGSLKFNK
jgi:hypothetical protein